jgi:hypothetical protein
MSSTGEQSIASATTTLSWAGDEARLFVLSGHDDPAGVIANVTGDAGISSHGGK